MILVFMGLFACLKKTNDDLTIKDGIYVEVRPNNADSSFYTSDNQIYRSEREFLYDVSIISSFGDSLYMKDSTGFNDVHQDFNLTEQQWSLVPSKEASPGVVRFLGLKVMPGNQPFARMLPDYSQTVIELRYYSLDTTRLFFELTGLVENSKNVWIHPHRSKYFRILELNPFPYIALPVQVGTEWTWCLEIGDLWGDYRWKLWQGTIVNHYTYKIENRMVLETRLGLLDCHEVVGKAQSDIGVTHLTAHFNSVFGFVRLVYTNIDKSQVVMNLVGVRN
ncbi:MAG: hypothetical protein ACK5DD_03140 [Cyclobacteriaceae bacterium]|jgi:hypothetical protein